MAKVHLSKITSIPRNHWLRCYADCESKIIDGNVMFSEELETPNDKRAYFYNTAVKTLESKNGFGLTLSLDGKIVVVLVGVKKLETLEPTHTVFGKDNKGSRSWLYDFTMAKHIINFFNTYDIHVVKGAPMTTSSILNWTRSIGEDLKETRNTEYKEQPEIETYEDGHHIVYRQTL